MRKIGFAKYKKRTKEVLPKTYKINEITCQRKMFCIMINQYLSASSKLNIKNKHTFENSLLHIFEDKIMSFFQFYKLRPEQPQKITQIYIQESLLLNQFFKQSQNHKMRFFAKNVKFNTEFKMLSRYTHPVVDLIQLIFNGTEIEMMLDLNEIFTRTVYNRIKKEKDKVITLNSPYIHITQGGVKTRLHPRWKHINATNLTQRDKDINDGFEQLKNEDIDQCYLLYPKTDSFKKYITIQEKSSQLKMIPYSFTFCNR